MNYKKIYDDLMQSRLLMKEARISARKAGEYFEAHHIVPVCMGGEPKQKLKGYKVLLHDNIVLLTAKEHWISHALLYVIHKTSEMALALRLLSDVNKKKSMSKRILSSKLYVESRIKSIEIYRSEKQRKKISEGRMGCKHSAETRKKMSETHKIVPKNLSDDGRKRLSDRMKGNKIREETFEQFISKPKTIAIIKLLNDGIPTKKIAREIPCDHTTVSKVKKLAFKILYELSMTK